LICERFFYAVHAYMRPVEPRSHHKMHHTGVKQKSYLVLCVEKLVRVSFHEQQVPFTSESSLQPRGLHFCYSFFLNLFIHYMFVHFSCLQTLQKRESDLLTDGCEPPCGCWDLNSRPLEEQSGALTHWAISPALLLQFYDRTWI
jgi:hypothetical protein